MKKIIIIFALISFFIISCEKDYEKQYATTYPISGDWYTSFNYLGDSYGPYVLSIYNTSFGGADTVWVSDNGNFWTFKVKAKANVANKTFSIVDGIDLENDDTTQIMNGRILNSNNDSIHFLLMFASSPGDTIVVSGHRKTGLE